MTCQISLNGTTQGAGIDNETGIKLTYLKNCPTMRFRGKPGPGAFGKYILDFTSSPIFAHR
jgi:hypothetical protein